MLVFTSCLSLKKDSYLPLLSFHELACLREHLQHPNVACNSGVLQKLRVAEAEARMHHCTRPNTVPSTTACPRVPRALRLGPRGGPDEVGPRRKQRLPLGNYSFL